MFLVQESYRDKNIKVILAVHINFENYSINQLSRIAL
jgi:hypothetical protein